MTTISSHTGIFPCIVLHKKSLETFLKNLFRYKIGSRLTDIEQDRCHRWPIYIHADLLSMGEEHQHQCLLSHCYHPRECRNNWDRESPLHISCDHNHKQENTPGFIIPNTISLKDWNSTTLDSVPYLAMLSFSRRERLLQNPKMLKLPTTIASVMSNPNWASENIYQYPKTETMLYKVYKKMIMFTEKG